MWRQVWRGLIYSPRGLEWKKRADWGGHLTNRTPPNGIAWGQSVLSKRAEQTSGTEAHSQSWRRSGRNRTL